MESPFGSSFHRLVGDIFPGLPLPIYRAYGIYRFSDCKCVADFFRMIYHLFNRKENQSNDDTRLCAEAVNLLVKPVQMLLVFLIFDHLSEVKEGFQALDWGRWKFNELAMLNFKIGNNLIIRAAIESILSGSGLVQRKSGLAELVDALAIYYNDPEMCISKDFSRYCEKLNKNGEAMNPVLGFLTGLKVRLRLEAEKIESISPCFDLEQKQNNWNKIYNFLGFQDLPELKKVWPKPETFRAWWMKNTANKKCMLCSRGFYFPHDTCGKCKTWLSTVTSHENELQDKGGSIISLIWWAKEAELLEEEAKRMSTIRETRGGPLKLLWKRFITTKKEKKEFASRNKNVDNVRSAAQDMFKQFLKENEKRLCEEYELHV